MAVVTEKSPIVSVCVPAFNQGHFIRECIESVRGQTLRDWELVIIDDGSTDGSASVIESIDDHRIRIARNATNTGVARTRTRCLALARGKYVAWLDADDVYSPTMLERQVGVLDANPSVSLVHGGFRIIGDNGQILPDWPQAFPENTIERSESAFAELVLCNYIAAPTVMVRRHLQEQAGAYATDIGPSSTDWEMWMRLALLGDIAYTAEPISFYRQHAASISATTESTGTRLRCDLKAVRRVFQHHGPQIPLAPVLQRRAELAVAARLAIFAASELPRRHRHSAALAMVESARLYGGIRRCKTLPIIAAIMAGAEYRAHAGIKKLLHSLLIQLEGSRFADRIRKVAAENAEWNDSLRSSAEVIRRVVPRNAHVLAIDKWDPTLLHMSGRRGDHFPNLQQAGSNYPEDSASAVRHLQDLQKQGASHLVIPAFAFWWLEHYAEFRQYLQRAHREIWNDHQCVIFELREPASASNPDGKKAQLSLP